MKMNACIGIIAFFRNSEVKDRLSPNAVVGLCIDDFFAFRCTMEVEAVAFRIIAMA